MTGDKVLLSQFEEKVGPHITFGDDNKGFTMGYDNLEVENVIINEYLYCWWSEAQSSKYKLAY